MTKRIFVMLALVLAISVAPVFANDCGNGKDHGKGTPACKPKGGDDNGGGSSSSGVVVTNENLNTVSLHNTNNSSSTSSSTSSSNANSSSNSNSSSVASAQGGNAAANQTQTANGGNASNGGQQNVQSTNFNQVRQTPLALAPEATSTAPCRVAGSGAGSSPFFGVSFSGSKVDTECEKRATAMAFAQLGQPQAAVEMLCATKAAKNTDVAVCKALAEFKKSHAVPAIEGVQQ